MFASDTYFFLDVLSYILLYTVFVHRFLGNLNSLILHFLALRLCELWPSLVKRVVVITMSADLIWAGKMLVGT